jgi:hypothetical protein
MKREKPKQPRTLRTIVRNFLRAGTHDLGDGQRGSDVARNDSMMVPFFPKCKGALPSTHLHVSLPFSSMAWARDCMCVHAVRERDGARE